jgi:hypothetical protein
VVSSVVVFTPCRLYVSCFIKPSAVPVEGGPTSHPGAVPCMARDVEVHILGVVLVGSFFDIGFPLARSECFAS